MKSLFLSPHYDDAVFSCGKLIAILEEPTVLTVFGGVPQNEAVCTAYDQKSGFSDAGQAVRSRRSEDSVALTMLGAKQAYLDFPENQYGEGRDDKKLEKMLRKAIAEYDEVYAPLGMLHPDHEALGNMMRGLEVGEKVFYVYAELPYYVDNPELFVEKLASIPDRSYVYRGGDLGKKMVSVACYESQARITNMRHLLADERYYV